MSKLRTTCFLVFFSISLFALSTSRRINKKYNDDGEFIDNKDAKGLLKERVGKHEKGENDLNMHLLEEGDVYGDYDEDYDWDEVTEDYDDVDGTDADHKVRDILKRMDKNRNDKISHEELLIWVFKAFHSVDVVDMAEEDFEDLDQNEDKKVSWGEYLKFEFGDLKTGEDADEDGTIEDIETYSFNKEANRIKSRFYLASNPAFFTFQKDVKNDTFLDLEQYKVFLDPFKTKKFSDNYRSRVLASVDTDQDGKISEKEFQLDWAVKPSNLDAVLVEEESSKLSEDFELYQFLREQRQLWSECDLDKNGKLEGLEITLWLSPQNVMIASEEVELLFELVGNKHPSRDGELMFHEIIEVAQDWVDQTSIIRDGYFHHKEL